MSEHMVPPWRILAILGKSFSTSEKLIPSVDIETELAGTQFCEVHTLHAPTLATVQDVIANYRPNVLYIWAGCTGQPEVAISPLQALELHGEDELLPEDMADLVAGANLEALVLNVNPEGFAPAEIRQHVKHVVHWPVDQEVTALNGVTFAACLFGFLRQPSITFVEAFALANHVLRAHGCADTGAKRDPIFAILDSEELPELPGTKPLPVPHIEGIDLSLGFSRSIPGWENIRLLSPMAECSLLLASSPSILDVDRLAALGLAMRAFCCLEAREAQLVEFYVLQGTFQHIVPGTETVRVVMSVPCGARFPLLMGVPPQVAGNAGLLQAAAQATLSYDAISLRFQLPPHGAPAPEPLEDPVIAQGCKTTPSTLITSVWVVHMFRHLASLPHARALSLLGVGAVSVQPALGLTQEDAVRFQMLQTQQPILGSIPQLTHFRFNQTGGPPAAALDMNVDVTLRKGGGTGRNGKIDRGATLRETKFDELTANAAPVEQWNSSRPPLPQCTQQAFLDDLASFLSTRFGWTIDPNEFPNAVLNGSTLDLFNLYRAVVGRGGFRMGNAINWKGEIFTQMSNWTEDHKMTGVGNALKRHYQRWLWEYERANQRDIAGDRCMLCQGGVENGGDWVECATCHRWQHVACDPRGMSLKEIADAGSVFECLDCMKRRHQAAPPTDPQMPPQQLDQQEQPPPPQATNDVPAA